MNKGNKYQLQNQQPIAIRNQTNDSELHIDVYGVVGNWWDGITVDSIMEQISLSNNKDIVFHINSVGGDVYEGLTLYNRIKGLPNKTKAIIEGLSASIASIVMLACDEVHMALGSQLMIHNPSTYLYGESAEFRACADLLDKAKEGLLDIYVAETSKNRDELAKMMDDETWFSAQEAYDNGFVSSIDESIAMVAIVKENNLIVNGLEFPLQCVNKLAVEQYPKEAKGGEEDMKLEDLTLEMLAAERADLIDAIKNEAIQAERERMKALDAMVKPGIEDIVEKAKYETFACANDVAMEAFTALCDKMEENSNALADDAKVSNSVGAALHQEPETKQEQMKAIVDKVMANLNKEA